MKPSPRDLVVVLLLIGMPLGAYFMVLQPANERFAAQRTEINEKNEKLEALRHAVKRIDDLDAEVARLTKAVVFFEDKLPQHHEIHKVLASIDQIAKDQQLDTELFETQKLRSFGNYAELRLKIKLNGDFDNYYQFLIDLERMPRITRVDTMDVEAECDKLTGRVKAELTVCIFFERGNTVG